MKEKSGARVGPPSGNANQCRSLLVNSRREAIFPWRAQDKKIAYYVMIEGKVLFVVLISQWGTNECMIGVDLMLDKLDV